MIRRRNQDEKQSAYSEDDDASTPAEKQLSYTKGRRILLSANPSSKSLVFIGLIFSISFIVCFYSSQTSTQSQQAAQLLRQSLPHATNETGSWASCLDNTTLWEKLQNYIRIRTHPDSEYTTISCTRIHYRIRTKSLQKIKDSKSSIVIGVLSGASGEGPTRRQAIRSTWALAHHNVFFVVAGLWSQIEKEYTVYGDLLWIDLDEVYVTETSVLTFKTESFLSILYNQIVLTTDSVQYLLKTDDDSYIAMEKLSHVLIEEMRGRPDYWGNCVSGAMPHREKVHEWQRKWFISYEVYPEPFYPTYCKGAGFALSRTFLHCAFGNNHAAHIRYQPNEDVAVGHLAERCNITATHDERVWIRYDAKKDGINMDNRVIQHYVKSEDMKLFHDRHARGT